MSHSDLLKESNSAKNLVLLGLVRKMKEIERWFLVRCGECFLTTSLST
jgi:hypothetical protein